MKKMINITTVDEDVNRYQSADDLEQFINRFGCGALEVMLIAGTDLKRIPKRLIMGVHLNFLATWLDFWLGDKVELTDEYGSLEAAYAYYGGNDRKVLLEGLRRDLAYAEENQAEYVVFHVSEINTRELLNTTYHYSDAQVIEAACDVINQAMAGREYSFEFLVENLWWPGFTMTNTQMTKKLLDGIDYQKKGIMFDTGHLIHTNLDIKTQPEAVEYILDVLNQNAEFIDNIRGIHLNQSITGDYVKEMMASERSFPDDYTQRMAEVYPYIFRIDRHLPFTDPGVKKIIEKAAPEYLVFEFITESRSVHERYLQEQAEALR